MHECLKKLQNNYRILLKIIHVVLSSGCLSLMIHYEIYELPTWQWIIYSIDSVTYMAIGLVMLLCYTLKTNCRSYDFYFMVLGIPLHITAVITGIIQELFIDPNDVYNGPNQLYLSSLLALISLIMMVQVALTLYVTRKIHRTAHTENASGTQEFS